MANSYLKHNNIFFVPILRQRISFAVLVQRAVHNLKLDERDLIAVALPESIRVPMQKAINKLPTVSFITSSIRGTSQREVFPVSPADGMVEAIRIAEEQGIPLRYIDQEVPPGHLIDRHCISFQDWPDDEFVLERGIEWYFSLIQKRLSHPPDRFEPLDTWREQHMAERIRRYYPVYRNILVVCHAAHVNPIKRYLRDRIVLFESDEETLPQPRLKVSEPSLDILLRYLGDIPRLVELYEMSRREGRAREFNKLKAIIKSIHQLDTTGFDFSIRNYQAFTQLLRRMLEFQQRISPTLDTILLACISCFNKPFERRVFRHLLGYFDQVKVRRIVHLIDTEEELAEIHVKVEDLGESYVARSCNLLPTREFEIIKPPKPPRTSLFAKGAYWPPWEMLEERMKSKAIKLANERDIISKSVRFEGTLYDGIDFRRTLRSFLEPMPNIYVKKHRILKKKLLTNDEPIVWLFDLQKPDNSSYSFAYSFDLYEKISHYCTQWSWEKFLQDYEFEICTVQLCDISGKVDFPKPILDPLDTAPKSSIRKQPPLLDDFDYHDTLGSVLAELAEHAYAGRPWWEILLLGAINYANESVLCVVPQEFVIPQNVSDLARLQGKTLERISLSRFTHEEQQKLRHRYRIESNYIPKATKPDRKDENFAREMEKRFGYVMEQFWS